MEVSVGRLPRLTAVAAAAVGLGSFGAAAPSPREPLLAVVQQAGNRPAILARFDPFSLSAVSPKVEVGEYHHAWSFSPDGSQLALARGGQGIGIQIVDLAAMKLVREVQTGIAAEALGWLAPRRLVAGLQRGGTVLVDPVTGAIVRRWPGFSFPDAWARSRDGLVMLLPRLRKSPPNLPLTRVAGPPRLAVADAQGLRSVLLGRIRLGVRVRNGIHFGDYAGLAVDPERGRAYVFAGSAPVAEIDLRTMRISYHRLRPSPSGRARRNVLARDRSALWLGDGRMLVFGRDELVPTRRERFPSSPAGASLIDTATWRRRLIDAKAGGAAFAGGRLLAFGSDGVKVGLRAYTLGGRKAFELFKNQRVLDVFVTADWAYVRLPTAVYVIDVTSGKIIRKITPPVDLLDLIVGPS